MAGSLESDFFANIRKERERLERFKDVPTPPTPEERAESERRIKKQNIAELLVKSQLVAKLAIEKGVPTDINYFKSNALPLSLRDRLLSKRPEYVQSHLFNGWVLPVQYPEEVSSGGDWVTGYPSPPDYIRGVGLVTDRYTYKIHSMCDAVELLPGSLRVFSNGVEADGIIRINETSSSQSYDITPDQYDRNVFNVQNFERTLSRLAMPPLYGIDAIEQSLVNFAAKNELA